MKPSYPLQARGHPAGYQRALVAEEALLAWSAPARADMRYGMPPLVQQVFGRERPKRQASKTVHSPGRVRV